jgi:hypothetical protein
MICWSCRKEISDTAKRCPHCEAEVVEGPTEEWKAAALDALASMEPEVLSELRDAFEQSATGEEFLNRIMVGDCPKCGSSKTADCENDPDIEDPCVGRCLECGQLWCLDCGEFFTDNFADHDCPAWEDVDFDDDDLD